MSSSLSALAQYRILPSRASGSWMILAVAARAPYAMVPLGTMTAITASTGSVATGGLATGLASAAGAVAGPLIGRWADHAGQRRVLLTLVPLSAVAFALLLTAALTSLNGPLLWAVCLLLGSTAVPIGSFTRARWTSLVRNPRELSTAFSYESTVDEMTFVLGPALVGVAASAAFPAAPIALAAALVLLAGIPFAITTPPLAAGAPNARGAQPDTLASTAPGAAEPAEVAGRTLATDALQDPDVPVCSRADVPPIPRVLLAVLPAVVIMLCIGANFGSVQAATTERAALLGADGSAGLAYALMGLGSAATALAVVLVPNSVRLAVRVLIGGAGMALMLAASAAVSSLVATALLLFAVGLFVGPTMVTAFSIAERRSPTGGISVAMTSMQSSITVGVSLGAMLGGALTAASGPVAGFAVAIGAGVVIALVGLAVLVRR